MSNAKVVNMYLADIDYHAKEIIRLLESIATLNPNINPSQKSKIYEAQVKQTEFQEKELHAVRRAFEDG